MDITCISDLHGNYPELEGGDLLIVAGDLTATHREREYQFFCIWLNQQRYRKKIFISGNHDPFLQGWDINKYGQPIMDPNGCTEYLCDSGTEFEGLKIWGSPWTLKFDGINPKCTAFTGDEALLASKFALIPDDIDILVTHGPPYGAFDMVTDAWSGKMKNVGSHSLKERILKICPKLNVFGHIHEGYQTVESKFPDGNRFITTNCSHVNEHYQPVNKPVRIVL